MLHRGIAFSSYLQCIASSIFYSPSLLHDKTSFSFLEIFAGGAKRRPVRFEGEIRSARRAAARLAILQNEVRAENISAGGLFRKKVAVVCDFTIVFRFFYPFLHRFETWNLSSSIYLWISFLIRRSSFPNCINAIYDFSGNSHHGLFVSFSFFDFFQIVFF